MHQSGRAGDKAKKRKCSAKSGRVGITACANTDKGVSSRGSRVRTKFYGSIIDSGMGVIGF